MDTQAIWTQAAERYKAFRDRSNSKKQVIYHKGVAVHHMDTTPSFGKLIAVLNQKDEHGLDNDDFLTAETLTELDGLEDFDEIDAEKLIKKVSEKVRRQEVTGGEEGLSVTDAVRAIGRVDQGVTEILNKQQDSLRQLRDFEQAWNDAAWGKQLEEDDEDIGDHLQDILSRLVIQDEEQVDPNDFRVLKSMK